MKYYLIALLFTVQYSFAQNFDYKVISENPNFQISFPALPDSQTISHKEYFAVQYSLLNKKSAYSFSVLTIRPFCVAPNLCSEPPGSVAPQGDGTPSASIALPTLFLFPRM